MLSQVVFCSVEVEDVRIAAARNRAPGEEDARPAPGFCSTDVHVLKYSVSESVNPSPLGFDAETAFWLIDCTANAQCRSSRIRLQRGARVGLRSIRLETFVSE